MPSLLSPLGGYASRAFACSAIAGALLVPASQAGRSTAVNSCAKNPSTWCGDGGPATAANLAGPEVVAAAPGGSFLIGDTENNVIRRVSSSGTISRVAGIGRPGYSGDGGPATGARIAHVSCVRALPHGAFVFGPDPIRRVSAKGVIKTVERPDPCAPAVFPDGSRLELSDAQPQEVDRVWPDGERERVAGDGACGLGGDGGPATLAELADPKGLAVLPDGGFLIADTDNNAIRRVSPDGIITTVAGQLPQYSDCGASPSYGEPIYLVLHGPLRGRAYRPLTIRYETSYRVAVKLVVRFGSRIVARFHGHASVGEERSRLNLALPAGRYRLELRARGKAFDPGHQQYAYTKSVGARLLITR